MSLQRLIISINMKLMILHSIRLFNTKLEGNFKVLAVKNMFPNLITIVEPQTIQVLILKRSFTGGQRYSTGINAKNWPR